MEYGGIEEAFIDDFSDGSSATTTFGCNGGGSGDGGGESEENPDPFCGNGILEGLEECDDGNQNDSEWGLSAKARFWILQY